jgi:hypothetical protein
MVQVILFLAGLAVLLEVANVIGRALLMGSARIETLRTEIRKTHQDLADAAAKIANAKGELRQTLNKLDRAKSDFESTEKEIAKRQKSDPVMVYRIGPEVGTGYRFRAKVTKALPEKADPNQVLLWSKETVVEIWVPSEEKASQLAWEQFPAKQGYALGPFVRTGDEEAVVVGQAA